MTTFMRVTRIDLDEREMPETVTVVMSGDVADRLRAEYVGCLMHANYANGRWVTVEWPMNVPVKAAKLFGRMVPTDDVIHAVYDCLSSLCNRFWEDGVDEAVDELGVTV